MKPSFKISIRPNGINAAIGEYLEEKDILEFLSFDENQIEDILSTHAAHQAYWEALTVRLKNRYESFESDFCKKWWAHNKSYAKYVLESYKEPKPTVEAIKDMTILIYSEDASAAERDKFLTLAHTVFSDKKRVTILMSKEEFEKEMFRYTKIEPAWYFETMTRTLNKLREDYELVQVVAKKLDSRSYHVGGLLELLKAKKWNIGPIGVDLDKERRLREDLLKYRKDTKQ